MEQSDGVFQLEIRDEWTQLLKCKNPRQFLTKLLYSVCLFFHFYINESQSFCLNDFQQVWLLLSQSAAAKVMATRWKLYI